MTIRRGLRQIRVMWRSARSCICTTSAGKSKSSARAENARRRLAKLIEKLRHEMSMSGSHTISRCSLLLAIGFSTIFSAGSAFMGLDALGVRRSLLHLSQPTWEFVASALALLAGTLAVAWIACWTWAAGQKRSCAIQAPSAFLIVSIILLWSLWHSGVYSEIDALQTQVPLVGPINKDAASTALGEAGLILWSVQDGTAIVFAKDRAAAAKAWEILIHLAQEAEDTRNKF